MWARRHETGPGNEAFRRLDTVAPGRWRQPNLLASHEPGPRILYDDGNGAIPQVVNRMVIQSQPGRFMPLPAVPGAGGQGPCWRRWATCCCTSSN